MPEAVCARRLGGENDGVDHGNDEGGSGCVGAFEMLGEVVAPGSDAVAAIGWPNGVRQGHKSLWTQAARRGAWVRMALQTAKSANKHRF